MNQVLDSPLEALAFNYISFGIFRVVNSLWTWVAVITGTAAVSFWRIRAAVAATSSCSDKKSDQKPSTCIINHTEDESQSIPKAEEKPTPSVSVSAPASVAETSVSAPLVCNDGATKGGKFRLTVYYEDDGDSDVNSEITVTEWSDGHRGCKEKSCGEWWESWERVLSLRKGETRWYRYQDLTAINGNVVRLWDESCRRGRYSSNCAVW